MSDAKPIKAHTFNGRRYRIELRNPPDAGAIGTCDDPSEPERTIYLSPQEDDFTALEVAIHEGLHACFWFLTEEAVDQAALDLASFIQRLGLLREDD